MSLLGQENRMISIETPLGDDVLVLAGFSGTEGISMPFAFELDLVSENDAIAFKDIIGKNVTISIELMSGETRFINGIIARFSQERVGGEGEQDLLHARYSATMVPWIWYLSRQVNTRIFTEKTVPQIVEEVCSQYSSRALANNLQGSYPQRDYCVQYGESDLDFISRLLEQEGIFYYFKHEKGRHTLVLGDSPQEHQPCPHQEDARYELSAGGVEDEDVIRSLGWMQEIRFKKYTLKDYNFLQPGDDLKVEAPTQSSLCDEACERYDYPGTYLTRTDGERLSNIRMQAEEARITTLQGTSICRAFVSGYRFTLADYPRNDLNNKAYVLTTVRHEVSVPAGGSADESQVSYRNSFTCIPHDVPYRPPLHTPKPVIAGIQTAVVTDDSDPDKHGRVKVRFPWDREAKESCWVRVGQLWAGQGWGAVWLPRVGHEVMVGFIDGDPDRPIITGSVYNANNTAPYALPDEKTKGTIRSQFVGGGGYNELSFDDKQGAEQIYLQGDKDLKVVIKNDATTEIGNIDTVKAKQVVIEAQEQLSLKVGTATVTLKNDGSITIKGLNLTTEASAELKLKGVNITAEADAQLGIKGAMVNSEASGVNVLKGSLVQIN